MLLLQRKLRAPCELVVSGRTERGYPCWKRRGSRLQWVLLVLVCHGTPGLWSAKPVYPNVSRELGGHTAIATPVLSDHHGSSSQHDPVTRPQGLATKNTLLPGSCWGVSPVCRISHFGGEWSLSQAGWVEELALGGGSIVILMGLLHSPPYTRTHL